MNKICRTLCLPFGSPAAKALDGKEQAFPDVDRYVIPDEIDAVLLGSQSAWKDVAFFLIYTLEPEPPRGSNHGAPSMWNFLTLLQRRMRPFLTPATCQGEWLWHCVTLLHNLISLYFRRICKERMLPCSTSPQMLLSANADQAFIELIMPLVRDLMMVRGPYEMATSMENIARLTQISAMHATSPPVGTVDPFKTDFQSMVMQSTDLLNDPTQSARHVSLLRVFSSVVPALSLQMPSVIGELLPLVLQGIDPTDTPKTMSSLRLLLCLLINVPCLDSNDWQLGDHSSHECRLRWPLPTDCKLKVGDPDCSATGWIFFGLNLDLYDANFSIYVLMSANPGLTNPQALVVTIYHQKYQMIPKAGRFASHVICSGDHSWHFLASFSWTITTTSPSWFGSHPRVSQTEPGLVSSMLPPFAIELVERACDYVTRIPKPRAVKSGRISLELATMGLLHGALCIAGSQTDKEG